MKLTNVQDFHVLQVSFSSPYYSTNINEFNFLSIKAGDSPA